MSTVQLLFAIIAGLVSFIAAVMLLNRGNPWFINARAQKEPLLVGLALFVVLARPDALGAAAFVILFGLAMAGRFHSRVEI